MRAKTIVATVTAAVILIAAITAASLAPVDGQYAAYSYLKKLGWETSKEPIEKYEFKVPEEFDQVYEGYNKIQQQAGFDLKKYKGKNVVRYTFILNNYYGLPDVRANVIVYNRKIIGGDIMTTAINGFMEPLTERVDKDGASG